jgi:hypothetical protein
LVKDCAVNIDGMETKLNLNILPLGSYDPWNELVGKTFNYFKLS